MTTLSIFDRLLSLVAPHECMGCGAEGKLLCARCASGPLPAESRCYKCQTPTADFVTCAACRRTSPLGSVVARVSYQGLAKELVWRLKFGRSAAAAVEIAELMAGCCTPLLQAAAAPSRIVTPAPTAAARIRERGYDQAARIAGSFADLAGLPYRPLLMRLGRERQLGASRARRARQLEHSFRAVNRSHIRGAHIILVDDVITTGATLEAAAVVLLEAGARRVDAVVFAQA